VLKVPINPNWLTVEYGTVNSDVLCGTFPDERMLKINNCCVCVCVCLSHYMRQLLEAIRYCHSHGIIHRNLQPQFIVLSSSGNSSPIKLTGFGTAVQLGLSDDVHAGLSRLLFAQSLRCSYLLMLILVLVSVAWWLWWLWACGIGFSIGNSGLLPSHSTLKCTLFMSLFTHIILCRQAV